MSHSKLLQTSGKLRFRVREKLTQLYLESIELKKSMFNPLGLEQDQKTKELKEVRRKIKFYEKLSHELTMILKQKY